MKIVFRKIGHILLLFLLFISPILYGQPNLDIAIFLTDDNGKRINNANIVIKTLQEYKGVSSFKFAGNGKYHVNIPSRYKGQSLILYIEIDSIQKYNTFFNWTGQHIANVQIPSFENIKTGSIVVEFKAATDKYVYVDEWIRAPTHIDRWGHPSGEYSNLNVRLLGPSNIQKGTKGTFILEINPEHGTLPMSNPRAQFIVDINLALVTTAGYIQPIPPPVYKAAFGNNHKLEKFTDVSENARKTYIFWGNYLPSVIKAIPVFGKIYSFSDSFGKTAEWIDADEMDWEKAWDFESRHNTYPIIKPFHSTPGGLTRRFEIEIPFVCLSSVGSLWLSVENIVVKTTHNITQQQGSRFHNEVFTVIEGENIPTKEFIQLSHLNHEYEQKISLTETNENINLLMEYTIQRLYNYNDLQITLKPVSHSDNIKSKLINVNMSVEIPEDVGRFIGMPKYYNQLGTIESWNQTKESLGKSAITNWAMFGIGFLHESISGVINLATGVIQADEASFLARESVTFTEQIIRSWNHSSYFNVYQLPPFKNTENGISRRYFQQQNESVHIDIPMVFYTSSVSNIYININAEVLYNDITNRANPVINQIAYRIPILFREKEDALQRYLVNRSRNVLLSIRNNEIETFEQYIHPNQGVRFSPFAHVHNGHRLILRDQLRDLYNTNRRYSWGGWIGKDSAILLSFREYLQRFVYQADYLNEAKMNYNKITENATIINNIREFYPRAIIIEYLYRDLSYTDWSNLRIVFEEFNGEWYVVGIVNDEWTP